MAKSESYTTGCLRTKSRRAHRSLAGGVVVVEHTFIDEPASLGSAAFNMLRLAEECGVSLDQADQAMRLLR